MRLLLPDLERERGPYGMKEKAFAKTIINVLCLDRNSEFAREMLNSSGSSNSNFTSSDFSDIVYKRLRTRYYEDSNFTISDINQDLNSVSEYNENNNIRAKEDILFKLIKSTSAFELKWLIRIILKEIRLGIGRDKILKCFHEDAVKMYESTSNLSKVCDKLLDSNIRLHEIFISMFDAFNPMLSQKCDKKQFNKCVKEEVTFIFENKFDGERFQLHMEDGEFKYFSRRGFEYSEKFGSNFSTGIYTPLLRNVFRDDVKSVILDGEMMGWNTRTKKFGSKGMHFDVKKLTDDNTLQPCFCAFDLVYFNGQVITGKPLLERKELLKSIIKPMEGVILVSSYEQARTKQEVLDIFNKSVDLKEEGIVFKNPNSLYIPNDRYGGWWKMKLEYFEGVMSDLDLLILGGYYGQGRHRNKITGFLLGVGEYLENEYPKKFVSMEKVSTGLSNNEIEELDEMLNKSYKKLDNSNNHESFGLVFGKELPDVWIEPEKSCVLQVRSSELIKNFGNNPAYKTKYSLRFARILKIRADKPYHQCLTTRELDDLTGTEKIVEKLDKRHLELSDLVIESPAKRRKLNADNFLYKYGEVEEKSDLLERKQFVVLTGEGNWSKEKVEQAIRENGGVVNQSDGKDTYCLLIGDPDLRTSTYKKDIVSLNWLRNILNEGTFEDFKPMDMIVTSEETRKKFAKDYDNYGDSFTKPASEDSLEFSLKSVEKSGDYINCTNEEINDFYKLVKVQPKIDYSDYTVYFDKFKIINDSTSKVINEFNLKMFDFQFYGGSIAECLTSDADFVFSTSDEERVEEIQNFLTTNNFNVEIISELSACTKIH